MSTHFLTMKKVVLRLKELRGEESQAQFAAKLGLPQQTYYRYESGKSEPPLTLLKNISLKFGVSADWLLGLSSSKQPKSGNANSQISQAKLEGLKAAIRSLLDQY